MAGGIWSLRRSKNEHARQMQEQQLLVLPEGDNPLLESYRRYQSNFISSKDITAAQAVFRALQLSLYSLPCLISLPFALLLPFLQESWNELLAETLQACGTTWIKLGQWMSTRPDLFPKTICDRLADLQDRVQPDDEVSIRSSIQRSLQQQQQHQPRQSLDDVFSELEPSPVASGSIAQVHRGVLRASGDVVAVKVLRGGVRESVAVDVYLLQAIGRLLDSYDGFKYLGVSSTVNDFTMMLCTQLDLRVEQRNIETFKRIFARNSAVRFPFVFPELSGASMLVEKYENGLTLAEAKRRGGGVGMINNGSPTGRALAQSIMDVYSTMLLHNYVHADLHPANILVKMADPQLRSSYDNSNSSMQLIRESLARKLRVEEGSYGLKKLGVEVVILDCGLVAQLPRAEARAVLSILNDTLHGRYEAATQSFLSTCAIPDAVLNLPKLRDKIRSFLQRAHQIQKQGQQQGAYLESLQDLAQIRREHRFAMRSNFTPFIVSSLLVEGTTAGHCQVVDSLIQTLGGEDGGFASELLDLYIDATL